MIEAGRHSSPARSGIDLRGQLASAWLRRRSILAVALLIALAVLGVRSFAAPVYATDATMRINVQGEAGTQRSEAAAFYAQTVIGVSDTQGLLETVVARSGLPISPVEAADRISVAETDIPGFLMVTATGPSPAASMALANATTSALALRLAQDEAASKQNVTAPLRAQIITFENDLAALPPGAPARTSVEQQVSSLVGAITEIEARPVPELILGPPPVADPEPISPVPLRDALLAFLVALIVAAEFVVVSRALRGRLSESDPAGQVRHDLGLPAVELGRTGDPAVALAALYRSHLRDQPAVTVIQLGPPWAQPLGEVLARSALLVGDDATHVELVHPDDADPTPSPTSTSTIRTIWTIRARTVDTEVLQLMRHRAGAAVLAVSTTSASARVMARDLAGLRAADVDVVAVIVWHGPFPRHRIREAGSITDPAGDPADVRQDRVVP